MTSETKEKQFKEGSCLKCQKLLQQFKGIFTGRHSHMSCKIVVRQEELSAPPQSSDWISALTQTCLAKIKPCYEVLNVALCHYQCLNLLLFVTGSQCKYNIIGRLQNQGVQGLKYQVKSNKLFEYNFFLRQFIVTFSYMFQKAPQKYFFYRKISF